MSKQRSAKRTEFLTDCYTTALEGGINYWSICHEYAWSKTQRAVIEELGDDDSGPRHTITLDTIAKGVNLISNGTPDSLALHGDYIRDIRKANRENEWDTNMDAIHGDVILQVALFGKVIYG